MFIFQLERWIQLTIGGFKTVNLAWWNKIAMIGYTGLYVYESDRRYEGRMNAVLLIQEILAIYSTNVTDACHLLIPLANHAICFSNVAIDKKIWRAVCTLYTIQHLDAIQLRLCAGQFYALGSTAFASTHTAVLRIKHCMEWWLTVNLRKVKKRKANFVLLW